MSIHAVELTSPLTTVSPVVTSVSHATFDSGSLAKKASRIASEIWSATLSGWPSDTDSEVKNKTYIDLNIIKMISLILAIAWEYCFSFF
jgi:hypothetical protein